jgi:hypothetical protein
MADNRLIYQLTDGTPVSTDVVPYSGPASGDAFKATVQELFAAGAQPQNNILIGLDNTSQAFGATANEGFSVGSGNRNSGCAFSFGEANVVTSKTEPCSFAYGYSLDCFDGGFGFGYANKSFGNISNPIFGAGGSSYGIGFQNQVSGKNNVADGYDNVVSYTDLSCASLGSNQYRITGNYLAYFTGGYLGISYVNSAGVRVGETVAYNNPAFDGTYTTFELASLTQTLNGTPQIKISLQDCDQTMAYGFANQAFKCHDTFIFGRGNAVYNGDINTFVGYGFNTQAPNLTQRSLTTYVGGDCNLDLSSTKICYNTSMNATPPASYTTSLTVDANGNINLQNTALRSPLITINQTSDIDVNSIQNLGPLNLPVNGQTFRLMNIGANTITIHKDNATGNNGYRFYWAKSGNSIALGLNDSVQFTYLSNLALSGSTGGWVVIPDGIG